MQIHVYTLREIPFRKVCSGEKIIESRLYDEKRQRLHVGDKIRFVCGEKFCERSVKKLLNYSSFMALMQAYPAAYFGWTTTAEALEEIEQFYTKEEQERWGVVGIVLGVC